jgi:hypothetical protein
MYQGFPWLFVALTSRKQSSSVTIPSSGHFAGVIPGWGSGELVALVSAEVLASKNHSLASSGPSFLGTPQTWYLELTLKNGSLIEWTDKVSSSGRVSLDLPLAQSSYRLFAFYQLQTYSKNLEYTNSETKDITGNGSFIVDHYSARGAQTITKFWETHLLDRETSELLKEVGNYGKFKGFSTASEALTKFLQDGRIVLRLHPPCLGLPHYQLSSNPNMDTI